VNLGEHLDPDDFRAPSNTHLCGYVQHTAVFPHAALIVNHAGLGSIVAALTFGLPMLCLPIGRDQPTNARAVEALGAGRVLSPEAPPEEVRDAIVELLASPGYRHVAMRVAAAQHARRGPESAVEELEQLVSAGRAEIRLTEPPWRYIQNFRVWSPRMG
jgi:UDP:flavonoid glycosyltransferase YjiC (YdhE family)